MDEQGLLDYQGLAGGSMTSSWGARGATGGYNERGVRVYNLEGDPMHRLWGASLAARAALEKRATACIFGTRMFRSE